MLGLEDGFDTIALLDSLHLVLVMFSPSSEVRGSEDDYDSLMCVAFWATFLLVLVDHVSSSVYFNAVGCAIMNYFICHHLCPDYFLLHNYLPTTIWADM
jgi:hypothetical protein